MTRFEALQERFAAGDWLSPEEDAERRELALGDPLASRELEIYDELRARLAQGDAAFSPEIADGALAAVGARPHLAVVTPGLPGPAGVARPTRRNSRWLGGSVALAAAAAAAAFWPGADPVSPAMSAAPAPVALSRAELVLSSGSVETSGAARVGGAPLLTGERLATREGRACLTIDPGIDVCLGGRSSVLLESLASNDVRVRVERGTALAALSPRDPGRSFSLTAGAISARARGTVFAVEHGESAGQVDVVVMEGVVEVESKMSAAERVLPHSRVRLDAKGRRFERAQVGRGEEARLWALGSARELWAKPELGVVSVLASGAEAVAVDDEPALTPPLSAFVPAGRRRITVTWPGGERATTEHTVIAGELLTLEPAAPESAPALSPEAAKPASPEALLAAARRELAGGNARAALGLYERLRAAHPGSPEASTVLVTIGKLELDLKQPARALASFDEYSKRGGPLAQEALAGKIRALRALGRTADERRAIETYLERYPRGFDAPNLRRRLEAP